MSILGAALLNGLLLAQQPPGSDGSQDEGVHRDGSYPNIDKAWGKVVSVLANWAPAFFVAAEWLVEARDGKVIAAELLQRAQACEGAGAQENLLLAVRIHGPGRGESKEEWY